MKPPPRQPKNDKPKEERSGKILKFVETDDTGSHTGRTASFSDVEFKPLQYVHLSSLKSGNKVTIPLRWENASISESNIPEVKAGDFASAATMLETLYSPKTIGLVKGGWLPAGIALQNNITVLPDRCTISELKARFSGGAKRKEDKDFLDFFADHPVRINPLLFAIESNIRTIPTPDLIEQQLDEARSKIKSALPQAELVPDRSGGLRGALGIVRDSSIDLARKGQFLASIAPKFRSPISSKRRQETWKQVLIAANSYDIPKHSLVVIAALSAIAVPNGKSPARRLLKFSNQQYSPSDAYNALSDLRSLEILMRLFGLFPNEKILLCTGDKDLALFWCGIRASDFTFKGDIFSCKISPIEELIPDIGSDYDFR
ncbi:MAG: hypothetical protein VYC49_01485 [Pseudomonadota bacterium]|nr:hypothetical protein [Pseudomonadota bacterium]